MQPHRQWAAYKSFLANDPYLHTAAVARGDHQRSHSTVQEKRILDSLPSLVQDFMHRQFHEFEVRTKYLEFLIRNRQQNAIARGSTIRVRSTGWRDYTILLGLCTVNDLNVLSAHVDPFRCVRGWEGPSGNVGCTFTVCTPVVLQGLCRGPNASVECRKRRATKAVRLWKKVGPGIHRNHLRTPTVPRSPVALKMSANAADKLHSWTKPQRPHQHAPRRRLEEPSS